MRKIKPLVMLMACVSGTQIIHAEVQASLDESQQNPQL